MKYSRRGFRRVTAVKVAGVLIAAGLAAAGGTSFGAVTYTGSGDGGRSASVTFDKSGGDLLITLADTGTEPTTMWDATYLVGAVFFNYTGPGALAANGSSSGAVLPSGDGVIGTLASGSTIGSYWAYASGVTGAPNGATQVLAGVGYGVGNLPANGNMGPNPQKVDGAAGSLLGWNNVNGANASVTGHEPLAYTTIVFTLHGSGLPGSVDASDFSDVTFQYGTMLSDEAVAGSVANVVGAPLPEADYGMAAGFLMMPLAAWGFLKKARVA